MEQLTLTFALGRLQIRVEITDQSATSTMPKPETECVDDILATLFEVGHRATTDQILTLLEQHNRIHGECTIKTALARMVKEGRLTQDRQGNPRGYGLPEWDRPARAKPAAPSRPGLMDVQPAKNGNARLTPGGAP